MKRILFAHHTAALSGSTANLVEIVRRLNRSRFEPMVLFTRNGPAVALFREMGVRTRVEPSISIYLFCQESFYLFRSFQPWRPLTDLIRFLPSAVRMSRILRAEKVHLLHINTLVQLPALLGAVLARVPALLYVQEGLREGRSDFRAHIIRLAVRHGAARVVSISSTNHARIGSPAQGEVVYQLIDLERFNPRVDGLPLRSRFGIGPAAPVIGMLGGTLPHKGIVAFLESAAILHRQRPDIRFLIGGAQPNPEPARTWRRRLRNRLEDGFDIVDMNRVIPEFIRSRGIADVVHFTGPVEDVSTVIAAMSLLALPAQVPQFGRPLCEAGAMARPVIASDFPDSREIVSPGIHGLLIPPDKPQAWADAVIDLLEKPKKMEKMAKNGYLQARKKFDAEINAARLIAIYDFILQAKESF